MELQYWEEIENTNRHVLEHWDDFSIGSGIYTLHQTGGRGTHGRPWKEEKNKGLAMSLAFQAPTVMATPLPLICGLAVSKALQQACGVSIELKWCNDLIAEGKKLGGILCESRLSGGMSQIVVGIGINLNHTQADFDERDLPHAISLYLLGKQELDPRILALEIQHQVKHYISLFLEEGFSLKLREEYEKQCVTLQHPVAIHYGEDKVKIGTAIGVASTGALRCVIDGVETEVHSGDVSVRGLYGYV